MAKARQPAASNRTGREQAAKEKFAKIQMDRSNKFRRGVLVCFIKDPKTKIGVVLTPPPRGNPMVMIRLLGEEVKPINYNALEVFVPEEE